MAVIQREVRSTIEPSSDYIPMRILEIELGQSMPTITAFDDKKKRTYQLARCLVRLHTQPLGLIDLEIERQKLDPSEYAPKIWQALHEQINEHLREDGLSEVTELNADGLPSLCTPKCIAEREAFLQTAPFVSVVIPTHERLEQIAACLPSLLTLHYPSYEVIVVDNAPTTQATVELVSKLAANCSYLHYVREDHKGSTWARNRGILEAKGEIIAFADDDVVVDPNWLVELARGFETADKVACVTSQILPLELDTPSQILFEAYGGFTRGFRQRIFDLREHCLNKPAYPYNIGECGTGASMAFTAAFLKSEGGFDPVLGVGTPTLGGVDIAAFFSVIISGYRLVYRPTSLLYHQHRRNYTSLEKQIYSYGVGFTAHITKAIVDRPWLLFDFVKKCIRSLLYLANVRIVERDGKSIVYAFPAELKCLEWKGRLRGPLAYLQSRLAVGWTRKGLELLQESIADSQIEKVSK